MTAAHVSDEFFCEGWKQIFLAMPDGDELIPVITVKYARSKKRTDPNRGDDPLDLAVLELRPDIADKLSTFMRFVSLNDLALDPDKLTDGRYLVIGYPEFRAEKDETDQTIVAQILPYFTGLYDMERVPALNTSPADHIVLDVNRMDEAAGTGDRLDLDQAYGISGGGMWRILDEDQPIASLDWRHAKLAAVITDRSPPEVMGPAQYLRGTKIKRAINFIYEGWPWVFTGHRISVPRAVYGLDGNLKRGQEPFPSDLPGRAQGGRRGTASGPFDFFDHRIDGSGCLTRSDSPCRLAAITPRTRVGRSGKIGSWASLTRGALRSARCSDRSRPCTGPRTPRAAMRRRSCG